MLKDSEVLGICKDLDKMVAQISHLTTSTLEMSGAGMGLGNWYY